MLHNISWPEMSTHCTGAGCHWYKPMDSWLGAITQPEHNCSALNSEVLTCWVTPFWKALAKIIHMGIFFRWL